MKRISSLWIISILLTVFVGFSSCSKDDDDTIADPTSILTANAWEVDDVTPEGSSDINAQLAIILYVGFNEPSDLTFKTGGVLEYTLIFDGTGTWVLSADFKTLTLKKSDGTILSEFQIVSAKKGEVKLKKKYTKAQLESSSDITAIITLIPQTE